MIKLLGVQTICLVLTGIQALTIITVEFQTLYQEIILSGKMIKEIILLSVSYLKEISLFFGDIVSQLPIENESCDQFYVLSEEQACHLIIII